MKRQRPFGECVPRNNRQSSTFQSVMRKELYIWCEEQRQTQRVNVHQKALQKCLKNGKDPLISSKDAGSSDGNALTWEQAGLRHGDYSRHGGRSGGKLRGCQNRTSLGKPSGNAATYRIDRVARHQTSNQQSTRVSSGYDQPQHNRASLRGRSSVKHRPHRSRNAIEVIGALNDTDQKARLHSKVGMLVNKRFEVQQMIDQGSYGQIFMGFDHLLLRKVAVKFDEGKRKADRTSSKRNHLKDEYDIYTTIRNNHPSGKLEGIPEPYWYGEEFGFRILALELLGASLHALFTFCDFKLGLETVFEIGKQMLERVRVVHESGYIHCDIKPENFLMGVGGEENVLYLIDFGLSRKYKYIDEDGTLKHVSQEKTTKGYVGTAKYASLNSLRCQALSRRDDLESVAYVLAEMIKGEAPFRVSSLVKSAEMGWTPVHLCAVLTASVP
ncbi:Serine/threonine protein kinase [Aphelenchoides avenae]|nr:Serine/threonine protein kinase [Aphelenchus avenae]